MNTSRAIDSGTGSAFLDPAGAAQLRDSPAEGQSDTTVNLNHIAGQTVDPRA
jgi:hypothetical protein